MGDFFFFFFLSLGRGWWAHHSSLHFDKSLRTPLKDTLKWRSAELSDSSLLHLFSWILLIELILIYLIKIAFALSIDFILNKRNFFARILVGMKI